MNPVLECERLVLRPFHSSDRESFLRLLGDPVAARFTGGPLAAAAASRLFDQLIQQPLNAERRLWAITLQGEPQYIGHAMLKATSNRHEGELAFYLLPDYWGKGYATEAVQALVKFAFTESGFTSVLATADPDHAASVRVLEKIGMTILRRDRDNEGRFPVFGLNKTSVQGAPDVRAYNRVAWDRKVEQGNRWTVPVTTAAVEHARNGRLELLLTPTKPVPASWFPPLAGTPVLCLASGGGQQGPLLAAAGAKVVVFDNSPRQLQQDRLVAQREGLSVETVEGDMADLSMFADETFNLVFHPCSNCFAPDVRPVWRECFGCCEQAASCWRGFVIPFATFSRTVAWTTGC